MWTDSAFGEVEGGQNAARDAAFWLVERSHIGPATPNQKNLKANSKNHYKTIQREKIREIDENNEKSAVLVSPGFSDFGIFFWKSNRSDVSRRGQKLW